MFYWLCYRSPRKILSWQLRVNCTSGQRRVQPGHTGEEEIHRWPQLKQRIVCFEGCSSSMRLRGREGSPHSISWPSFPGSVAFILPDQGTLQLYAIHVYSFRCFSMRTKPTTVYQHIRILCIMNVKLCTCRYFSHCCGLLQTVPLYLDGNAIHGSHMEHSLLT